VRFSAALAGGTVLSLLAPFAEARAGCISGRFSTTFGQAQPVDIPITITDGGCSWGFTGGLNVTYESIAIVRRPAHLTITPLSNGFGMSIRVNGGYKGRDAFSVRACGRNSFGPGCFTVNLDATIK
jgi:hypothetical protein